MTTTQIIKDSSTRIIRMIGELQGLLPENNMFAAAAADPEVAKTMENVLKKAALRKLDAIEHEAKRLRLNLQDAMAGPLYGYESQSLQGIVRIVRFRNKAEREIWVGDNTRRGVFSGAVMVCWDQADGAYSKAEIAKEAVRVRFETTLDPAEIGLPSQAIVRRP